MNRSIIIFSACVALFAGLDNPSAGADVVKFRLDPTDTFGASLDTFQLGDEFDVHVWIQDVRERPQGIFSAFLDVEYDSSLVSYVPDSVRHGDQFGDIPRGDFSAAGLLDEVGSFASGVLAIPPVPEPLGGDEYLFFTTRFRAEQLGIATFAGNPADVIPRHATTAHGSDDAVPVPEMVFVAADVTIVPEPSSNFLVCLVAAGLLSVAHRRMSQLPTKT